MEGADTWPWVNHTMFAYWKKKKKTDKKVSTQFWKQKSEGVNATSGSVDAQLAPFKASYRRQNLYPIRLEQFCM